jgi:hypothetical protein
VEALNVAGLGLERRQGQDLQVVAGRRRAEDRQGLGVLEPGQLGGLEEGAGPVGLLDQLLDGRRRLHRQAEADVDGVLQPGLEVLVADAQRRLERADHVADHILAGVVQQGGQPPFRLEVRLDVGGDLLDHHAVLGHREAVLAGGLAVPARHPGQAVGDVLDLDVHRRGIQQVEPAARQHALPRPGRSFMQPFGHEIVPYGEGAGLTQSGLAHRLTKINEGQAVACGNA